MRNDVCPWCKHDMGYFDAGSRPVVVMIMQYVRCSAYVSLTHFPFWYGTTHEVSQGFFRFFFWRVNHDIVLMWTSPYFGTQVSVFFTMLFILFLVIVRSIYRCRVHFWNPYVIAISGISVRPTWFSSCQGQMTIYIFCHNLLRSNICVILGLSYIWMTSC